MPLPEMDVARIRKWCADRVPADAQHQVRLECHVQSRQVTIVERRAPWREDFGPEWSTVPMARLRYTTADRTWTLYWVDRHQRFHRYPHSPATPRIGELLDELDRDPTHIFWG